MPDRVDPALMPRAADIFLEVRSLGLAQREEAINRLCAGDHALRDVVFLLLRGDQAPLRVESLADDIRAAHDSATIAAKPENAQGSHIGRYRLLERIGEGGFGVVFAADQTEPVRRRVALKIIKLGMDTRQVVARFEAERQALAMMDHPNIAKVFDAGATDTGRPYFVMELVRGMPITDYCDARKLDIFARLSLFAQVCDALQHAHQKGIIHRDIKPSNILVTESGDQAIPKVIDFGIAKATSAELTDKTVFTELRQMIGTPEYMSPEQAGISALDIDTRTDVYSLGVLLYELLTGSTPFESRRLRSAAYGEVQRIIREEDPPRPSTRLTQIDTRATIAAARGTEAARLGTVLRGELDWVVMKCLEKDRARRYDSAGALMSDIRRFIAGETVQAVPPSTSYRFRKFIRKNKGPVFAGSLLALTLMAGLIGTTLGLINADSQRKAAHQQKRRADEKAADALAAEALAEQSAYSANMLSACAAVQSNQLGTARAFLNAAPETYRGWEWNTLHSRLDSSILAVACPMSGRGTSESSWFFELFPHPDGTSFFTARTMQLEAAQRWDFNGKLLARFSRPEGVLPAEPVYCRFSITPDGTRLSSLAGDWRMNGDPAVAVWDLRSNEPVLQRTLPRADTANGALLITADGTRVLRARGEHICLQDTSSGSILATGSAWPQYSARTVSPDGSLIALGSDRGAIKVLEAATLAPRWELTGHKNVLPYLEFSSDSRLLASASIDGTSRVWNLAATPPTSIVLEHPNQVTGIRLSPDTSLVATFCTDGAIRVWETQSGTRRAMFSSGMLINPCLMFMPDGRRVAGRDRDGTVRFWDVTADETVYLPWHKGILNGAYLANRTGIIVSAGWDGWRGHEGSVRFSDAETGIQFASTGVPGEIAYHLSVRDSKAAAVITAAVSQWTAPEREHKTRIELYDLLTGRVLRSESPLTVLSPGVRINTIKLSPRADALAVGRVGRLELRSTADLSITTSRAFEGMEVQRAEWSPDGSRLACITSPAARVHGEPLILDAHTLETVHKIQSPASAAAFSPDGKFLCLGSPDGQVSLWTTDDWKLIRTLPAHDQAVFFIDFSPDGKRLATVCGDEGDILIWNTDSWDRIARFHDDDFVASASWSADSTRLIGACGKTVRIWDATPLRDRVQLRDAYRAAVSSIKPCVDALLTELHDPALALERINADHTLSPQSERAARQLILKAALSKDGGPG